MGPHSQRSSSKPDGMPRSRGGFKRDACREARPLVTFAASVPPADQGDSHRGGRKSVWG